MRAAWCPSTGDPDADARIAAQIRLHAARAAEGRCPNGRGPIRWLDAHHRTCDGCGDTDWVNVPHPGRV